MNSIKPLSKRKIVILSIIAIVVIGLVIVIFSPSSAKSLNISAALSELTGIVQVRDTAQSPYVQVNDGFQLKQNMLLQTKEQSRVRLTLSTGSIIRLGQLTIFSLESQTPATPQGGLLSIGLQAGKIWIVLKGGSLNVTSPAGLASVRGSYMSVWAEPNRITITCLEGKCAFKNTAGSVNMTSGQKVIWPNATNTLTVEKMDQADVQDWLDNVPEAAQIIAQISGLLASSTPTPTPTLTPTPLSSLTPTQQSSPTSTIPFTPTNTLTGTTPTAAPSAAATLQFFLPVRSFTPTPSAPEANPTKTKTKAPTRTPQPTATFIPTVPTATPRPTATLIPTVPTATRRPSATPVIPTQTPQPTATRVRPTDETEVPQATRQRNSTGVPPTDQPTESYRDPTGVPPTKQPTESYKDPTVASQTPQPKPTWNKPTHAPDGSNRLKSGPKNVNGGNMASFQYSSIFEVLRILLPW